MTSTWFRSVLLVIGAALAISQGLAVAQAVSTGAVSAHSEVIPERTLNFSAVDLGSGSSIDISPVTSLPQCDTGGSLFLDMLDPKDLKKHTAVSFRVGESQTYLPSAIPDLHDMFILGFYPSSSEVAFLVRGTKDLPGSSGPNTSPAGITWSSYHTYIAEFKRDGSYKGTIQLPISYKIARFAIFPSGELLVLGYDELNSVIRLLLLNSSGDVQRTIDLPASRSPIAGTTPYHSPSGATAMSKVLASFEFTPYKEDILVWRANNNDPILDVSSGGSVHEVPLQVPPGFAFAGMIPSNDRWVGHFRSKNVPQNAPFTAGTYSYFELRPEDASIFAKLLIPGDLPQFLACEADGGYLTYKVGKDHKLVLLRSN